MRDPTTQEREDRYPILEQVNMSVTRVTCVAGGIYRALTHCDTSSTTGYSM